MNVSEARAAIEAILESIPDDDLPEFDHLELELNGTICAWWGGDGRVLGSAKSGGKRDPLIHRERASWDAIHGEMVYRADRRLLDNGDDPSGIRLAAKAVEA